MDNFSFTSSSPMSSKQENETMDRDSLDSCSSLPYVDIFRKEEIILILIGVVYLFGLLGNGAVIWLLGFRMKRTPFTTYILNLAVADFGVLIALIFMLVVYIDIHVAFGWLDGPVSLIFFIFFYSMSQFLLTTISIDRCVAVLFPLWYRCRHPRRLSTVLCALIWLLSFLVQGVCLAFYLNPYVNTLLLFYTFLANAVVCLPLITVSTLILFLRFYFKAQQRQRGKLLMAILLSLFFFLIFAFPLNVIISIFLNPMTPHEVRLNVKCYSVFMYGWLCASLNSFVNPLLYFLVGRKKRSLCRENLKLILHRVFMEEEEELCREV